MINRLAAQHPWEVRVAARLENFGADSADLGPDCEPFCVNESAGRRNRLPHPPPSGLAAMWGRQCCLPSAVFDRFFHTFRG